MNDFEKIGRKHRTDKISQHGYHRFYDFFLKDLRKKKIKMLEIGIEKQHSLKMWLEYFPKAFVYGIDKALKAKGSRYQVFKCSQEDDAALRALKLRDLDFIIDDGSHVPEHQLSSFSYLFFNSLKPGGIYIIEDVETSYWINGSVYGYHVRSGYKKKNSIVEIFKDLADEINKEFLTSEDWSKHNEAHQVHQDVRKLIGMITFCQNTIIIQKKDLSYQPFDNRDYLCKGLANRKPFTVYQSFFSEETKRQIDPGFIPFDNTGKLNELYENQILLDIYRDKKNVWMYSDYVGLLSWRFFEKTRLTSSQIFSRIDADKNKKQVYLLTPKQYIGRFPPVFDVTGFDQTTRLCRLCDEAKLFPFKLQHYNSDPVLSFCNYWLATPEIFADYVENYLMKVINFLRTSRSKEMQEILSSTVSHGKKPHPPHPFFLEGLFQCYVHYKQLTYTDILHQEPEHPGTRSFRIGRDLDFAPVNGVDHLIVSRA